MFIFMGIVATLMCIYPVRYMWQPKTKIYGIFYVVGCVIGMSIGYI
jgi:hypothetical protein